MRRALWAQLALVGASSTLAAPCLANGFLVYDLTGESIARAAAVSADVTEPAAVWYNPASLAFLEGTTISAGGVFVSARSRFEHAETDAQTSGDRGNFLLPALFANVHASDRISLALGVYSAFGIGVSWPKSWIGRENTISASLQTLAFNPTVALRLSDQWSVAAGLNAIRSTVEFENGLPAIVGGDVRLAGGTWGFGFNVGALYRAVPDRVHLALSYRSRVALDFDGRADFEPENRDFARALRDQGGHAEITLPDIITAGVLVRPRPNLALGFDANLVLWSTYDRVDIDFDEAPDRALNPQGHESFTLRAGADWSTPEPGFSVRWGVIFDRAAIPSEGLGPGLPDSDRIDLTAGFGYERDRWKADLGYMLVIGLPAEARTGRESPEGTYHTLAHLLGLTLGATF